MHVHIHTSPATADILQIGTEEQIITGFKTLYVCIKFRNAFLYISYLLPRYRWAEAAERANARSHTSLPRENKRKEPLGQANSTSPVYGLDNRYEKHCYDNLFILKKTYLIRS